MNLLQFKQYRERYPFMSHTERCQWHSMLWHDHPIQNHFDADAVMAFFGAIGETGLVVLELGGWRGALAGYVLAHHPDKIAEWYNVELCIEAVMDPVCLRPEYAALPLGRLPVLFDVMVLSHVLEHMDESEIRAALGHAKKCGKYLYIDGPPAHELESSTSFHITANWKAIVDQELDGCTTISHGWSFR